MSDPRPLLAFSEPQLGPIPPQPRRNIGRPAHPSPNRQGARIAPQFRVLRETLEAGRAALSADGPGTDPELVAVFDLAGSVDGFVRAVRDVEGLDFLADFIGEDAEPDDDFFMENKGERTDKVVPESIYMVMSNARAIDELISLFNRWVVDPGVRFDQGMNPLKTVFANLRTVRRWSPEDRVSETGLLEEWAETLDVVGSSGVARVEIELWYRSDLVDRQAAEALVTGLIADAGGAVIQALDLSDVRYHAVLADLPHHLVETVLEEGPAAIELLATDTVMFVTPSRPMVVEAPAPSSSRAEVGTAKPVGLPRVALLDGLPLANHEFLSDRLIVDDPDDFTSRYGGSPRYHGTAMASLICHGDLSDPKSPLSSRVYVRPVLQPHPFDNTRESTPPERLLVDLIHRCFVRMFEGDGDSAPAAPSVRVVNLSIGDPVRVFARQLSPLARLLDWLSFKYNCVVVVSAGNHRDQVEASDAELSDIASAQTAVSRRLAENAALRRMLSPAEAINVLTVGAVHSDSSNSVLPDTVVDLQVEGAPASYSPVGSGYRRAIKPDVLLPGGRQVHNRPLPAAELSVLTAAPAALTGPGLLSAGPGELGSLDGTVFTAGTSNSAALASRYLDQALELLSASSDPSPQVPQFPDPQFHPVLARAMLVHAARWGSAGAVLQEQLGVDGIDARKRLVELLGYGPIDESRVFVGDRLRATLVGAASIGEGERRSFSYPLPPSLSASTLWRRLTLTLAWLSPVNMRSQKYRMARLQLAPPTDAIGVKRVEAPDKAVARGTVHHELLDGDDAVAFQSGDGLEINIDCRVDAGKLEAPVRFGLVVSLEVGEGTLIDVFEEVRQQLEVQTRQRLRAQATA